MIFPLLSGFLSWRTAPVVWGLVALNALVLLYTSHVAVGSQIGLEEVMRDPFFVSTQGRMYAQYMRERGAGDYPVFLRELAKQVLSGESGRADMLGQLAFRDFNFLKEAPDMDFDGDQVAFAFWRKRNAEVTEFESDHPSFTMGMNAGDTGMLKWISYMFVHSNFLHFAGNMLFLVIFGAALERQIGGLGLLVVFLLSGMFAAGSFALMTGMTSSPLVGASGAISGIMALYCTLNWRRPTRYFYWFFLPLRGFMGMVYLPAWVAIVLWAANDLAGFIGTVPELGGVAHTAHLGGETAGLLTGLVLFALRRFWPVTEDLGPQTMVPMGVLVPFLPPKPTGLSKVA